MPATTAAQVTALNRLDSTALENCVARYSAGNGQAGSALALAAQGGHVEETPVIGGPAEREGVPEAPLAWRHGFHLRRLSFGPGARLPAHARHEEEVWAIHEGRLRVRWGSGSLALGAGDVLTLPVGLMREIDNPGAGAAVAFVVRGGDSPSTARWN